MGRKVWNFIKWSIFVLAAVFVGLVIFFVIVDLKEEAVLKNELVSFANKDLATDDFTVDIKTKGDYAYVEEAVKKYYRKLSDNVKALNYYLNNNNFITILSTTQLEKDRPDYTFSHATIKSTRSKINEALKNIKNLCDEKTIKALINKEKLTNGMEDYYYDLFLKYVYTDDDAIRLDNTKEEMENLSKQLNAFLDKIEEILEFFHENDEQLEFNDNTINFEDEDVEEAYNKLYQELVAVASDFLVESDDNKNEV